MSGRVCVRLLTCAVLVGALLCGDSARAAEQKIAANCTPGISFWSLLGAVRVSYEGGYLQMEKLYAVCLPQPAAPSNSNYAYSPDEGGKLATLVKDAGGQTLNTYVWSAENISGLWELSNYKIVGGVAKPLAAGSYTLEFQIEGEAFYRFAFTVDSLTSDDVYQPPGTRYFIDGPWSTYGNVFYQRNDPQSSLRFTVWIRDKAGHVQQKSLPYSIELVRVRDDRVIGRDEGELRADQQWRQLDASLQLVGDDAGASMKAATLLGDDGVYRVRFMVDGKLRGTYPFTVSGGKIALQGRQLESTLAMDRIVDYLYGGRYRSWWVEREGGAVIGR